MQPSLITPELIATACLAAAILHTLMVKKIHALVHRHEPGGFRANLFHLLSEVEAVFAVWAVLFLALFAVTQGVIPARDYVRTVNFTEPVFVFAILALCSTRPILDAASKLMTFVARLVPLARGPATYAVMLTVGPLLGSFITEPAAMTVTALLLLTRFFRPRPESGVPAASLNLKYATLGLLFVNISIGGTLTPYAAPPVLMVAGTWGWDLSYMLTHFGWKAAIAVVLSTALVTFRFRRELAALPEPAQHEERPIPLAVTGAHFGFLAAFVVAGHEVALLMIFFVAFLGLYSVTRAHQSGLRLKDALLVMAFLGGLVILGGLQRWWLEPVLTSLGSAALYTSATLLTAFTDNAALTYLGAQVPTLAVEVRYALVAGAVVGGGLTVIANAPNPAGFGILAPTFGEEGVSPLRLTRAALVPTAIAFALFWPGWA